MLIVKILVVIAIILLCKWAIDICIEEEVKEIERSCNNCKRQHTMQCPNTSKCYSILSKPYFEQKE